MSLFLGIVMSSVVSPPSDFFVFDLSPSSSTVEQRYSTTGVFC